MIRAFPPLLLALVLLILPCGQASGQTIPVRSGEHAGFSRLVLDIGTDRQFDLQGDGDTRQIRFEPAVPAFDLAGVFDLIPRTRLRDIRAGDGLTLDLACDCPVTVTRFERRYLIVDILEPEAQPPAPVPDADDTASGRDPNAARRAAASETLPNLTDLLRDTATVALPSGGAAPAVIPTPTNRSADIALEDAARLMAEQLARAAASGLLEAADGRPLSDADPSPPATVPDPAEPAAQPATLASDDPPPAPVPQRDPAPVPMAEALPLRAETATDAPLHRTTQAEPQANRLTCMAEALDPAAWSAGTGFDHGIGRLRRDLYNDRDQLVPDAALAIAQHYISYGFGAEARYWLDQLPVPNPSLVALAHLVDGTGGPHFPPLSDPGQCDERDLFWRYLDGQDVPALTSEQVGRLQRLTAALPPILRDQLAPRMARRLALDRFPDAARNLRDMLVRGGRLSSAQILHLDLDIGFTGPSDPDATREALALALRDDGDNAPAAMHHALRFDRETGIRISPVRLTAAEAMLREFGTTRDTDALWQEVVLAHAAADDIERVMVLLATRDRPRTVRDSTLTMLFADRLDAADTLALLLLARAVGPDWSEHGSEAGRARVGSIAHLRDHGFAEAADILRDGQRPLILPARPTAPTQDDTDLRSAWLAADWLALEGIAQGPHADMAARMQARADASGAPPEDDLATLTAAIADSRSLRGTVTAILADPAPRVRGDGS
jgi:hypothetical protein